MAKKKKEEEQKSLANVKFLWGPLAIVFLGWLYMVFQAFFGSDDSNESKVEPLADIPSSSAAGWDALDAATEALFSKNGEKGKSAFADSDYWEKRYAKTKQETYDWYGTTWLGNARLVSLKSYIGPMLPKELKSGTFLNLGCGNSRLAEELNNDGYQDVLSVDIAHTVIDKMKKKYAGVKGLRFEQMDATKMSLEDNSIDAVIEKGTLDALFAGHAEAAEKVPPEVFRVLRPGGKFISISFGKPSQRTALNNSNWESSEQRSLKRPGHTDIWMYSFTKPK
eukprot:TRINITY_DN24472_c0_g1_i2.p1 TRINITY_DN24472_c0_g1~~TRINITY_DN24472_c0_g1_i2.p1  ORF type:complete len:292 (+),score=69.14 TRINITY_DN24472_c0_g1_i2:37-876(+)